MSYPMIFGVGAKSPFEREAYYEYIWELVVSLLSKDYGLHYTTRLVIWN